MVGEPMASPPMSEAPESANEDFAEGEQNEEVGVESEAELESPAWSLNGNPIPPSYWPWGETKTGKFVPGQLRPIRSQEKETHILCGGGALGFGDWRTTPTLCKGG